MVFFWDWTDPKRSPNVRLWTRDDKMSGYGDFGLERVYVPGGSSLGSQVINMGQLLSLDLFPCIFRGSMQSPRDDMNILRLV